MTRTARQIVSEADRRLPVRIRVAVPTGGFGDRLNAMHAWLDENCGADGWTIAPSGVRGVVNDAIAIYFLDVRLAAAFVARWCAGGAAEIVDGLFSVRQDQPARRVAVRPHKTP